jgi:hypothetical protein
MRGTASTPRTSRSWNQCVSSHMMETWHGCGICGSDTNTSRASGDILSLSVHGSGVDGIKELSVNAPHGSWREFTSKEYTSFFTDHGTAFHLIASYSQEQNRVVEQRNQTIFDMGHSMLKTMNMPTTLWGRPSLPWCLCSTDLTPKRGWPYVVRNMVLAQARCAIVPHVRRDGPRILRTCIHNYKNTLVYEKMFSTVLEHGRMNRHISYVS